MGVAKSFLMKNYDINDAENVPIITKWLGREGLQLIQTLTKVEQ